MTTTEGSAARSRPGDPAVRSRWVRWAATAPFLVTGLAFAGYWVRMPSLKLEYGLSDGQLGLFLVLPVLSGLTAMQWTGSLVARFGSAPIARLAMVGLPLALAGIALAGDPVGLAVALLVFGALDGLIDVSMNAHAIAVERLLERPIMNSCHAVWSLGAMAGSVLGGVAVKTGLSMLQHFLLFAVILVVLALVAGRRLLPASADRRPEAAAGEAKPRVRWRAGWTPRVLVLGVTGTVVLVCEGMVGDWSGIFLHDDHGTTLAAASLGYICFSACQAGGRLLGDRLHQRYGANRLVRWTGAMAVAGLTVVVVSPAAAVAIAGFALLGLGMSVLVPIIFSAVGHGGAESGSASAADALSKVSTLTYSGLLIGPVLVGWFANGFGLTATLAGLLVLLAVTLSVGLRRIG